MRILNRPMFKQVKSPAYGTGISANLVSDDQRQRYNYGGRVGLVGGTGGNKMDFFSQIILHFRSKIC